MRILAFACLIACACSGSRSSRPPVAAASDTARGVIGVVGNEPTAAITLTPGGATTALVLRADAWQALLARLVGVELMVAGRATGETSLLASPRGNPVFRVDTFIVRAAHGVPAEDGILRRAGQGFVLDRGAGTALPIGSLPTDLQSAVGARIYLAGPLDRAPVAYGVIRLP